MSDTDRRSELMDELEHLRAKVAAVEALHTLALTSDGQGCCPACWALWPCATADALASVGDGTPTEPAKP